MRSANSARSQGAVEVLAASAALPRLIQIRDRLLRVGLDLRQHAVHFGLLDQLVEPGPRDDLVRQLAQGRDVPIVIGAAVEIDQFLVRKFLDVDARQPRQRQLGQRDVLPDRSAPELGRPSLRRSSLKSKSEVT